MSMFHEPDGSKDCLRNQLTTLTTKLATAEQEKDQFKGFWETACQHVKESLELLGVDVSVNGYVPDTWTLREQCRKSKQERDALEARVKELEDRYENCIRSMWMGTPEGRSECIRDYEDNFQATPQD
jgi:hypothetical protein